MTVKELLEQLEELCQQGCADWKVVDFRGVNVLRDAFPEEEPQSEADKQVYLDFNEDGEL